MYALLYVLGCLFGSVMHAPQVTDFGKLYPTDVNMVVYPKTVQEVQAIVKKAVASGKCISIAGARHSQGGHSNAVNSINIDTARLNKLLSIDVAGKVVRVQAGMTWEQLQDHLHPHGLSVAVMQASNIFSIGGAASVNVHGRDPRFGPMIETIQSCVIVDAQGDLQTLSRTQNPQLFSLVIGGYGLFGVIVEVTLKVVDNCVYSKQIDTVSYTDYVDYLQKTVLKNPRLSLHYARLVNIPGKKYLKNVVCVNYLAQPGKAPATILPPEKNIAKNQALFEIYRKTWGRVLNAVRWLIEEHQTPPWEKVDILTRNHAMRPYVRSLISNSQKDADFLQEYFIPVCNFQAFTDALRTLSQRYKIKLLNVTLRWTPANRESFLSYSQRDTIAFVLYFNTKLDSETIAKVRAYTQKLTQACLDNCGTFYLPYQRFATSEQCLCAYPQLQQISAYKREYDPKNTFASNWYLQYMREVIKK